MKTSDIHALIKAKQDEIKGKKQVKMRTQGEEIAGKTNASNPTTLAKLIDKFNTYASAVRTALKPDPTEPVHRKPSIEDRYHEMGRWLDMCPYELKDIMEHEYDPSNELVSQSLKKFLTAVKISNEVGKGLNQRNLKQTREVYDRAMQVYKTNVEETIAYNEKLKSNQAAHRGELYQAWGDILIDLTTKLQRNAKINELATWDQWMVKALSSKVSTDVCKVKKDGTVVLDFNKARFIDPSIIGNLPNLASKLQADDAEDKRREMYCKAPIQKLLDHLWNCSDADEFAEVAEVIRWRKEEVEAGHGEDVNYVLGMYEMRNRHRREALRKYNRNPDGDIW